MIYEKKMSVMYESFYKNAFTYTSFITYMFMFSIEIFWLLFEKYNIKSMMSFLKFGRFIKSNISTLVKIMRKNTIWIDVESLKDIEGFEKLSKVSKKIKKKKSEKIWILKDVKKYYESRRRI